tara:strand:- start:385 stop:1710 length:1326 start_codon:yes stop_codon:yes gene_type:complete
MKLKIKEVIINNLPIRSSSTSKQYTVKGDPGAVFSMTITNEDNYYYNFPENTIIENPDTQSRPAPAFTATTNRLNPVMIGADGVYTGSVTFPAVTDDDLYILTIYPEMHYDTELADNLGKGSFIFAEIEQLIDTTITFAHSSATEDAGDDRYSTYAASFTSSGPDTRTSVSTNKTVSLSYALSLSSDSFEIIKQPDENDFYFNTTKDTLSTGSGTTLELKDITGLSVGMEVIGTGISAADGGGPTTITSITPGYYNANKSTDAFPVYDIAKIVDNTNPNNPTLTDHPGGTVVIANSSTFVADRTLTFRGYGPVAAKKFNNTNFSVSNFKVELDEVSTTVNDTDANGTTSLTTFDLASVNGIKDDVSTVTGVGISDASTTTVTNISSNTITIDTAFKPENGQTLKFLKASRTGTITGDLTVTSFGSNNITLTLELDKILKIE